MQGPESHATRAQAYTPLVASALSPPGVEDLSERYLYLFACLAPACRNTGEAWRAVRAQRPAAPAPVAAPAPAAATPAPASPIHVDWGGAADDWGGDAALPGAADADLGVLTEQLDAALAVSASSAARQRRPPAAGAASARPRPAHTPRPAPAPHTLPEFYLLACAEPEEEGAGAGLERVSARAQELALAYQQHGGGGGGGAGGEEPDVSGGGEEAWAGEEYERPSVRGVSRAQLKFQKRLRRCPQQCVRYGAASQPLWPSERRPAPPPCPRCRGPRRFELQLMAPLIHFLGEGIAAPQHGPALEEALLDWDWATAVLCSCARSCYAGDQGAIEYSTESVWVYNAEEGEALRGLLRATAREEMEIA